MDTTFIESLIVLMRRHGIAELDYAAGDESLKLRLDVPAGESADGPPAIAPRDAPPPVAEPDDGTSEIRAPMAGCFYRAPAPDAPPFVEVGVPVSAGDPLALLEAMKMLTPVEAEMAGVVAAIHVENGQMVARGDLLITLRPGG